MEEARQYTSARDLLDQESANLSLGKHLSASIREGHNIYAGLELLSIKDEGFRIFLAHYFQSRISYRLREAFPVAALYFFDLLDSPGNAMVRATYFRSLSTKSSDLGYNRFSLRL